MFALLWWVTVAGAVLLMVPAIFATLDWLARGQEMPRSYFHEASKETDDHGHPLNNVR